MKSVLITAAIAASAFAVSSPAFAAPTVPVSDGTCTSPTNDTMPIATLCTGYYTGNIFDGNAVDTTAITTALAGFGITYTGNLTDYVGFSGLGGANDLSSYYGDLVGVQVFGVHYGGGAGGGESAIYQIDFGTGGHLTLNLPASSNIYKFSSATRSAVPEPATWALMLLGFGGMGMALRRDRRRSKQSLMQIA
jgi:hypothetical protein